MKCESLRTLQWLLLKDTHTRTESVREGEREQGYAVCVSQDKSNQIVSEAGQRRELGMGKALPE